MKNKQTILSLLLLFLILLFSSCQNSTQTQSSNINKTILENQTIKNISNQTQKINKTNFPAFNNTTNKHQKNQTPLQINSTKISPIKNQTPQNKTKKYSEKFTVNQTWQWQLSGKLNLNYDVDVYDVDLFETSKEKIKYLKNKNILVICYFSAGTYEKYRDDIKKINKTYIGNQLKDWPDEYWLDISKYQNFSHIMINRIKLAKEKGCDAIEPDNIDAYQNNNGFKLTYKDQIIYNIWLSEQAHKRNLAIGLKNDLEQIKNLEPFFDFAINEQCFEYDECELLTPFIKNNKPVFGVEYELEKNQFCEKAKEMKFSWLKMDYDLSGQRDSC